MYLQIIWWILSGYGVTGYRLSTGPSVKATAGAVWPKPQHQTTLDRFYLLQRKSFKWQVLRQDCDMLEDALEWYYTLITDVTMIPKSLSSKFPNVLEEDPNYGGLLNHIDIVLLEPCDGSLPTANMSEDYVLSIYGTAVGDASLASPSIWGILRGLETFSQLLYSPANTGYVLINQTTIKDFPRFRHRGLLIDTSRHFLPLTTIKQIIDGMTFNKLNVLHWHITDDQSFPYKSKKFPELSDKGAYHPSLMVYSQSDIRHVIRYAGKRGIRVIPEFDTPGHTLSWGEGYPDILTMCKGLKYKYGPVNPIFDYVYSFMEELFEEVEEIFPDNYLHLGGDEVEFRCWKSNADIIDFMKKLNITDNYKELENYYIQNILNIVKKLNSTSVVWQEVFDNGVKLPPSTIVQIWKSPWTFTIADATRAGHPVLLSACWYLDHLDRGWQDFYRCDPGDFVGTPSQKALVLGGEACMWGEMVNEYNIVPRIFPRVSAVAERLWSNITATSTPLAAPRLEEHACRMNKRGIPAQPPNGPGFCL